MQPLKNPQTPPEDSPLPTDKKLPCPRCCALSDWMPVEIELFLQSSNVLLDLEGPKAMYCVRCRVGFVIPGEDPGES